MKQAGKKINSSTNTRDKFLGIEENFPVKSYYPLLQEKIKALEENQAFLQEKSDAVLDALKALQLEKNKAQQYLDTVAVIILSLDFNGKVTLINQRGCSILGYDISEIIGRDWFKDFVPQLWSGETKEPWFLKALDGISQDWEYVENEILTKGNTRRIIGWHNTITYDENGSISGTLSAGEDITEKRIAQNALIRSENLYRELSRQYKSIFENMQDGYIKCTIDGRVILANPSAAKILKYKSAESLLGLNCFSNNFFIPSERQEVLSLLQKCNTLSLYPLTIKCCDNSFIDSEININLLRNEKGEAIEVEGIFRDVTEKKQIETATRQNAKNFRILFNAAPYGILLSETTPPFNVIEYNDTYLKFNKSRPETMNIETLAKIVNKEDYERAKAEFSKNGVLNDCELRIKDGETSRISLVSMFKIQYDKRQVFYTTLNDITAKRNTEIALEETKNLVENIINSIPMAIFSLSRDLKIIQYNRYTEKYISPGFTKDNSGLSFSDFPSLSFIHELIKESFESEKIQDESISNINESGNIRFYKISLIPVDTGKGKARIVLLDDITEKRKIEQIMIESEKMTTVAGLAAGMAHEINNPLGTIVQGCQNIIRRTSKELAKNKEVADSLGIQFSQVESYFNERQIYEILDSIRAAAGKASEIIKNMLQFSRKSESHKVSYSVSRVIDEAIALAYSDYNLKKRYDFKSIILHKEIQEGLPEINISVTEIQQVIFNILQNAAQAFAHVDDKTKQPVITIRAGQQSNHILIEIEDNGPGMPEKIKNRIFEPFFTTKDIGEGTGLGMSVSYIIINTNHHGELYVESAPGKGTTFFIKIPI
jgi:PAS domain S-box-containing protein